MKSVLISVQPYWVFLIIAKAMGWNAREKTIEVRKNFPKDENWDKVAKIYCSRDKKSFNQIPKEYQPLMETFLGKVVGEFVCDNVDRIAHCGTCNSDIRLNIVDKNFYCKALDYEYSNKCKLSYSEIEKYSNGGDVYGWHISNLVIYDKPRELGEFFSEGDCTSENCKKCRYFDRGNGFNVEDDCLLPYEYMVTGKTLKPLFRPPQSWFYVESEVQGE